MKPTSDAGYVQNQYRNSANLSLRQRFHALYSTSKESWQSWVFSNLDLPEGETVLELGCGNGGLWLENLSRVSDSLEITLTDISPGLLDKAKENLAARAAHFRFEVVDATRLPYGDGAFDVVIANHMLYHLKDVDGALAGIRRVLKPGGRFFASTMGLQNMRELQGFVTRSGWQVELDLTSGARAFGLENGGEILGRHFTNVELLKYPDSLVVPAAETVVEYLSSLFPSPAMPPALSKMLQDEIGERGAIHITKSVGMFRCGL